MMRQDQSFGFRPGASRLAPWLWGMLGCFTFLVFVPLVHAELQAVYTQMPSVSGGLLASSRVMPDGSDSDMYVYDGFMLATSVAVTEVHWRGGYAYAAQYGRVQDFTVSFYGVIDGTTQPDMGYPPSEEQPNALAHYYVGDAAGETGVGVVGGIAMYDYSFVLPSPFQVVANERYWIRIEAIQPGYPDWGIAASTDGSGSHIRYSTGSTMFQAPPKDAAFTLYGESGASVEIGASAAPPEGGEILGAGSYPVGSMVTLTATANPGYGFLDWTEEGITVSTSSIYNFEAAQSRTLEANFVAAYTVTTSSLPLYGGTTTGAGIYNDGDPVLVTATAQPGHEFVRWTVNGAEASLLPAYEFTAAGDANLVAHFAALPDTAVFDFDTGAPALARGVSLPFNQSAGGLGAAFSSPQGSAFSTQGDSNLFYHMSQFSGNYLWPNNIFRNYLDIAFDHPVRSITVTVATIDYQSNAEIPSNIRVSAYANSTGEAAMGSAEAHGFYASDSYPTTTLTYESNGAPFSVVQVFVPYTPNGTTNFMIDNIIAIYVQQGEGKVPPDLLSCDQNGDSVIDLAELLRTIQLYNSDAYHCDPLGEDGFAPGLGDEACQPHNSDYSPQDWQISLSELLRVVQFYNTLGYHYCPASGSEDGFCPGVV